MPDALSKKNIFLRMSALFITALCFVALLIPSSAGADADTIVRILLSTGNVTSLTINVTGNYTVAENTSVKITTGTYTVSVSSSNIKISGGSVNYNGSSVTLTRDAGQANSAAFIKQYRSNGNSYSYLGNMKYTVSGGCVRAVSHIGLEQYLYGVIGYEMANDWPMEALKAQAVCARSYVLANMHPSQAYDGNDTTGYQVYYGYNSSQGNVIAAVDATAGSILTYNGKIVPTYFSASNGGQTELIGNAWGGGAAKNAQNPYLVIKDDPYDLENPSSMYQRVSIPADPSGLVNTIDKAQFSQIVLINCRVSCNVRSQASTTGTLLGQATASTAYGYLGTSGEWYKISYNGQEGYVNKDYAELAANTGAYVYSNYALRDIQAKAYDVFLNSLGCHPLGGVTGVQITSVNSISTTERWPGTGSRSCVSAKVSVTAQYLTGGGTLNNPTNFDVTIALMEPNDDNTEYVNAHNYLSSSLRLRFVETVTGGWSIFCGRYGHGLGLSQRGAQTMAKTYGKNYTEILAFYFTGSVLMNGSSVVVEPEPAYTLSDSKATGIEDGTTVETLLSGIGAINGDTVTLKDANGNEKTTGTVGTGDVLTVTNSTTGSSTYTVLIYGDVNGDGSITIVDLLLVQKKILGTTQLEGVYLDAADISKDKDISILDLLRVQKHILGSAVITQ